MKLHLLWRQSSEEKTRSMILNHQERDKGIKEGFPNGSVVKTACQCGRHGFDPWSGKIPRAEGQLSPYAITESVL